MKRLLICALLVVILGAATATAGVRSPTPYLPTAACTWQSNGMVVVQPDGSRMLCLCERVEAIDEWWCVWQDLPAKAKPSRYRIKHRLRGVRYYSHPRLAAWIV